MITDASVFGGALSFVLAHLVLIVLLFFRIMKEISK